MNRQIEICCGSYYDALQAQLGGAMRIELNSALHMGGLTPSIGSLELTKRHTNLKVITMVRPRGAGFCYNEEDYLCMLEDTKAMLAHGADGIAFGCLDAIGEIHKEQTNVMVELIHGCGKEAVFHRAFDCTKDPFAAMDLLVELGVDRVLTSGLCPKAMEGKELLKNLQERYGTRIEILAGSGLNATNAVELMDYTGIEQVHSSCKDWQKDSTTSIAKVSFSYADSAHRNDYDVVSASLVASLIASL